MNLIFLRLKRDLSFRCRICILYKLSSFIHVFLLFATTVFASAHRLCSTLGLAVFFLHLMYIYILFSRPFHLLFVLFCLRVLIQLTLCQLHNRNKAKKNWINLGRDERDRIQKKNLCVRENEREMAARPKENVKKRNKNVIISVDLSLTRSTPHPILLYSKPACNFTSWL